MVRGQLHESKLGGVCDLRCSSILGGVSPFHRKTVVRNGPWLPAKMHWSWISWSWLLCILSSVHLVFLVLPWQGVLQTLYLVGAGRMSVYSSDVSTKPLKSPYAIHYLCAAMDCYGQSTDMMGVEETCNTCFKVISQGHFQWYFLLCCEALALVTFRSQQAIHFHRERGRSETFFFKITWELWEGFSW